MRGRWVGSSRIYTRPSRWPFAAAALALLPLAGCFTFQTQRPAAKPPPPEPTQVVQAAPAAESSSDAEIDPLVQNFIERVDRAAERPRTDLRPAAPVESGPVRLAADERPLIETRPEPQPVEQSPPPADEADAPLPVPEPPPPAPVVGAVRVRPVEPPRLAGAESADVSAAPNAPLAAVTTALSLRDLVERLTPELTEGGFREQLDARLVALAAGEYGRAREPFQLVSAAQQELGSRLLETLIALRDGPAGEDSDEAVRTQIERLQEALARRRELSIPTIVLCRAVRGFGQYDPLEPARLRAGLEHEFVVYCEVADFVSEQREDGLHHTQFDITTTVLSRAGERVLQLKDPEVVDRCRNRRRDCFIPRLVRLPATLAAGQYVVKVSIADKLGNKVAESRASLELIAGR